MEKEKCQKWAENNNTVALLRNFSTVPSLFTVQGWEDGLVGMKKSGKRLFVIPPDLGYCGRDTNATFPTNVPLMVYVILKRVKYSSKNGDRKLSTESSTSKQNNNEVQEVSVERFFNEKLFS